MIDYKNIKIHSVKYNFIMNTLLKISSFIFPLITFPYVSRVLGVELNGKIAFSTNYANYFTMIAQLGIPTYGIRACASLRDNKDELNKTVVELMTINLFTMLLSCTLLLFSTFTIAKIIENRALVLISSISVILSCIGVEWFYQAVEQYDYITIRNIAFKFISIGLMFLLIHGPEDYIKYAEITVLGTAGSNILNYYRIKKYGLLHRIGSINIKRHIKPILVFFLFTVSATIYTSMDSVMIGFLSNDTEVGLYAASTRIRHILYHLVVSIGTVLLPRASYLINNKEYKKYKNIISTSLQFIAMMSIPLTIYFVLEAKATILFLAGKEYMGAIPATMIILPTIILAGISNITGIQILIPNGFEQLTVISTFGGAVTDLILNFILIPRFGASGAAFGTLIAEVVVLLIQIIFLKKYHLTRFLNMDWYNFVKIISASTISGVIIFVLGKIILFKSYFIQLLVSAIVFFGIYGFMLIWEKEKIMTEYFLKHLSKILITFKKDKSHS